MACVKKNVTILNQKSSEDGSMIKYVDMVDEKSKNQPKIRQLVTPRRLELSRALGDAIQERQSVI